MRLHLRTWDFCLYLIYWQNKTLIIKHELCDGVGLFWRVCSPKLQRDTTSVQKAFISAVTAVMGTGADIIGPLPGNHGDARCCWSILVTYQIYLFPNAVFTRSSCGGSEDNERRNVRKTKLFTLSFHRQSSRRKKQTETKTCFYQDREEVKLPLK